MRRWTRRGREIFAADAHLAELGLIGGPERAREITPAGRGELARVDGGGG